MGKGSSPPPAPDPVATSKAQTASNVATATANSWLSNADETGPLGSVKYRVVDTQQMPDGFGGMMNVPKYERIETLSPEQQKLYDQQTTIGYKMNDLASNQIDRLDKTMSEPLSLDGLPDAVGDFSDYQKRTEDALFDRMNPQLDRERDALENKLVNQGLQRGTQAFTDAMNQYGQQANDARTSVFLASGQEAREMAAQQATARERALQERLAVRNQPLNEISALISGGQVTMPQFTPYRPGNVADTDYSGNVYRSAQLAQDAWKEKNANSRAMTNGIFNLGGSIVGGLFKMSDPCLKTNIERIGTLESGLGWYRWNWKWGGEPQEGVMADEVFALMPHAVDTSGLFMKVDYSQVQ